MKIIITLFCFVAIMQPVFAQIENAFIDSLYKKLKQTQVPNEQFKLLHFIHEKASHTGQIDIMKSSSEQMLKIATTTHRDTLLSAAYTTIGSCFIKTGNYRQALEYNFKALGLAEKSRNNNMILLATKEVGATFRNLKKYDEALIYFKKAEALLKVEGVATTKYASRAYTTLASTFLFLSQLDSAMRYVQLANEVTVKEKDPFGYSRVLYLFAGLYKAKGDNDLAEGYYKKCITFSAAENFSETYVTSTTDYAQYLFDAKKYDLSKAYALSGLNRAKNAKDKLGMLNAASLLRKVYYAIGQKDSAYFYTDMKDAYNDSIFNIREQYEIENLSFTEKLNEKEKEGKLIEEAENRNRNVQFILIAIGIVSFIVLFLLLSHSIVVTEKWISFFGILGLLIIFEFINLFIHPFLESVTHHSPVLMLLSLVFLASLLIPLHHTMEKWIKEKMIMKNKKIRLENAKKTIEILEAETNHK